jgi:hypothetical protein
VLTTWSPDDGERKALANAAPVVLIVHADPERQPPVSVHVGDPPAEVEAAQLLTFGQAEQAAQRWWNTLAERWTKALEQQQDLANVPEDELEAMPTPEEALDLWHKALYEVAMEGQETDLPPEDATPPAAGAEGNGHKPGGR